MLYIYKNRLSYEFPGVNDGEDEESLKRLLEILKF